MVFSSRVIPGNERAIGTVQDNLVRRGVRLMTDADHMIHVSGHPARDELRRLYRLVKPPVAVPVHGEWRHLSAHAELAQEAGSAPVLLEDGDILSLAPGTRRSGRQRPGRPPGAGRQPPGAADRRGDGRAPAHAVQRRRDRQRGGGRGRPAARARRASACPGCSRPTTPRPAASPTNWPTAIADLPAPMRRDDAALAEAAKTALRRVLGRRLQKRPLVDVHLLRV